jgi:arabinose-5-phosphate isomerase
LGDALAVALLDARGFGPEDFARSHPGGTLGRRLLTHVRDVLREAPPAVSPEAPVAAAILEISRGGIGMTTVVSAENKVLGIFTDGDIRRAFERNIDLRTLCVADVMTKNPRTIGPDKLAVEAVEMMEQFRVNALPVTDASGALIGALNMHDLFRAKVI